ncbi:MAG: hypothetical protein PHF25_00700 [Candidatus Margulisbacteria bacterium]|nr:hypothetical protein [Candidatus Margulisiibacteriota bacterium]
MAKFLYFFLFFYSFLFCVGEPEKIVFSNSPENIYIDGSLLNIQVSGSFRLFFSHNNQTKNKGDIVVRITSSEDVQVQQRMVFAGPDKSELYVGKILGERFFASYNHVNLTNLPMEWKWGVATQNVLSGIIDVFPENSSSICKVHIYFNNPSSLVFDNNKYIFPNTTVKKRSKLLNGNVRHNLKIADNFEFINNGHYSLPGNYGVLYEYLVDFSETGEYQLFFTANGGPASCVFTLDGEVFSVYSNNSKKVGSFNVPRQGLKKLVTFPLPGSNYPATVTIVKEKVYTE